MINSITIENFLSHKKTWIQLHPGVNVFLGESDVGKSAIFRAIRKVVENQPPGNEFVSWWAKDCYINLDLSEGQLVEWHNRNGQNTYVLCRPDGYGVETGDIDEQVFKAFRQGVPEEISQALNIEEINFQHQLANSFLFQQSPGEIARYLNQVVNLDIIDTALYNINKRLRDEGNTLAAAEKEVEHKTEEVAEFDWLDAAEEQLKQCILTEFNLTALRSSRDVLSSSINSLIRVESEIADISEITAFEQQVNDLLTLDREIENLCDDYDELQMDLANLDECNRVIESTEKLILAESKVKQVYILEKEIESLTGQYNKFEKLIYDLNRCEEEISKAENYIGTLEHEFQELMPSICPLCGKEVKANDR